MNRESFSQIGFTNATVGGSIRHCARGDIDSNSGSLFAKHLFTVTHPGTRRKKSFALKTKVEWGSGCIVPILSTHHCPGQGGAGSAGIVLGLWAEFNLISPFPPPPRPSTSPGTWDQARGKEVGDKEEEGRENRVGITPRALSPAALPSCL